MNETSFLRTISDVRRIITPIDTTIRFPEVLDLLIDKYGNAIDVFCQLIIESSSSADVLRKIRSPDRDATERMALLKMYRRCVAPVLDTETTKKIRKIDSEALIEDYGHTLSRFLSSTDNSRRCRRSTNTHLLPSLESMTRVGNSDMNSPVFSSIGSNSNSQGGIQLKDRVGQGETSSCPNCTQHFKAPIRVILLFGVAQTTKF